MIDVDFSYGFLNDFLGSSFEELSPKILEEVAPILEEATKETLKKTIQHPGDSCLVDSVKRKKPRMNKGARTAYIRVEPTGYSNSRSYFNQRHHSYKVTNGAKAFWLEYGVAGRQPARPWQNKAASAKEDEIMEAMQEKYNELTGADQ